ncbi:hypothetical protein FTX61_05525 [Nitriliruptoraceae bacterium ZYF776]|nr:hypothetical protein [Profundirhabdus halotolerans]
MATDVASPTDTVPVRRAAHRRRAVLLLAAAAFNLWVWATRIRNQLASAEDFSTAFVAVHLVLYTAAIGVALVVGVIGWRQWRESRRPAGSAA